MAETSDDRGRVRLPRRWLRSLSSTGKHLLYALPGAIKGFSRHYCTQLAAAMSYHVLFSIVPLAIVIASVAALILQNQSLQDRLIETLVEQLPVSVDGAEDVRNIVSGAATPASAVGLLALAGLFWAASGMMASLRAGLDAAWAVPKRHSFLLGKLVDFALVAFIGLLLVVSVVMTAVVQAITNATEELEKAFMFLGPASSVVAWGLGVLVPLLLSFGTFAFLYRLVPSTRPRTRAVIPGSLIAAIAFNLLAQGFAIYVAYFSNYNALYGTLGALFGFLLFVYLSAMIVLFGAELSAQWPSAKPVRVEAVLREKVPVGASRRDRARLLWEELAVVRRD